MSTSDLTLALIISANDQASKKLSGINDLLGKMAIAATAAAAATIAMAKNTSEKFQDVQQSLLNVKAVTNATLEQYTKLGDAALDAAEKTRFNPKQTTDALYSLASAGLSVEQSMDALKPTLDLAAASNADLGRSTENMVMAMSQFGLGANDATRVADVMTAAMSGSVLNAERMSVAFRNGGATAAAYGQSLEGSVGALSILANSLTTGEQAGTGLKSVFAELNQKSKALGITVRDSSGNFLPLVEIIRNMENQGWSTSKAIQTFGADAGPSLAILLKNGSAALQKMTDSMQSTGQAAKAAEIQNSGLKAAWQSVGSIIDVLVIKMGNYQQVGESVFAKQLKWYLGLDKTSQRMEFFGAVVGLVSRLVVPAIVAIDNAWTVLKNTVIVVSRTPAFKVISDTIGGIKNVFVDMFVSAGKAVDAAFPTVYHFYDGVAKGFNSVLFPVLDLARKAFISLMFSSEELKNNSLSDSELMGGGFKKLSGVIGAAFGYIGGAISDLWGWIKQFVVDSESEFRKIWGVVGTVADGVVDAFKEISKGLGETKISFGSFSDETKKYVSSLPLEGIKSFANYISGLGVTSKGTSETIQDAFKVVKSMSESALSVAQRWVESLESAINRLGVQTRSSDGSFRGFGDVVSKVFAVMASSVSASLRDFEQSVASAGVHIRNSDGSFRNFKEIAIDAFDAIKKSATEYLLSFEGMANQIGIVTRDSSGRMLSFGDVVSKTAQKAEDNIQSVIDFVDEKYKSIEGFFDKVSQYAGHLGDVFMVPKEVLDSMVGAQKEWTGLSIILDGTLKTNATLLGAATLALGTFAAGLEVIGRGLGIAGKTIGEGIAAAVLDIRLMVDETITLWERMKQSISDVADFINSKVKWLFGKMSDDANASTEKMQSDVNKNMKKVEAVSIGVADFIASKINWLFDSISGDANASTNEMQENVNKNMDKMKTGSIGTVDKMLIAINKSVGELWRGSISAMESLSSDTSNIWDKIYNKSSESSSRAAEFVEVMFSSMSQSVSITYKNMADYIFEVWGWILDSSTTEAENISLSIQSVFSNMGENIFALFENIRIDAVNSWGNLSQSIEDGAESIAENASEWIQWLGDAVFSWFETAKFNVMSSWANLGSAVIAGAERMAKGAYEWIVWLGEVLFSGFETARSNANFSWSAFGISIINGAEWAARKAVEWYQWMSDVISRLVGGASASLGFASGSSFVPDQSKAQARVAQIREQQAASIQRMNSTRAYQNQQTIGVASGGFSFGGFASGTGTVPNDGFIRVHQGEKIQSNHSIDNRTIGNINFNVSGSNQMTKEEFRRMVRAELLPEIALAQGRR